MPNLTSCQRDLTRCERDIRDGLAFLDRGRFLIGRALIEIRDKELYLITHPTLEEYVFEIWDRTRDWVYKLISAEITRFNVETFIHEHSDPEVVPIPKYTSHAALLSSLPPEEQGPKWCEVVTQVQGHPTMKQLREALSSSPTPPEASHEVETPESPERLYAPGKGIRCLWCGEFDALGSQDNQSDWVCRQCASEGIASNLNIDTPEGRTAPSVGTESPVPAADPGTSSSPVISCPDCHHPGIVTEFEKVKGSLLCPVCGWSFDYRETPESPPDGGASIPSSEPGASQAKNAPGGSPDQPRPARLFQIGDWVETPEGTPYQINQISDNGSRDPNHLRFQCLIEDVWYHERDLSLASLTDSAPGGSPVKQDVEVPPPEQNGASFTDSPPYEDDQTGDGTQAQTPPSVPAPQEEAAVVTGKRTSKRGQRQSTATAPPIKVNPNEALEARLWDLREKIPLLLSLLTTKRNNKKDARPPAPAREDVEETIKEFRDVTMRLVRGLRTSHDLRAAPPLLATVLAAAEANETMDPPISPAEATHYWERRGTSGWHYGTPAINPVRSLEHDLPSFVRTTRAGRATSEARYERQEKAKGNPQEVGIVEGRARIPTAWENQYRLGTLPEGHHAYASTKRFVEQQDAKMHNGI